MRIFVPFIVVILFTSCTTTQTQSGRFRDTGGRVVESASSSRRFYWLDMDKKMQIPDEDTKAALIAKMHCEQVEAPVIQKLTQSEEDGYVTADPVPKMRVRQATMPSRKEGGQRRDVTLPDGWEIDGDCTWPAKYAADKGWGFSADMVPHIDPNSKRQWVTFTSNYGGGWCNVFIRPNGTPPIFQRK
jgi:hypothetical protein